MTVSLSRAEAGALSGKNLEYLDEHLKRYIDAGKLAGTLVAIHRKGHLAHWSVQGQADRERGIPVRDDTIFRIYSMTKPISSVALMQQYERGLMQLDDPVERYIPSWKNLRVYQSGVYPNFVTTPCERPMTVRDLLSHQSGLTYGFMMRSNVDAAYRAAGIGGAPGVGAEGSRSLQELIEKLAEMPLEFSPGTAWNYSNSTDVVGYLVQVISGKPLDAYLKDEIFEPLGMVDTGFWVRPEQADRLASNYRAASSGGIEVIDAAATSVYLQEPAICFGGGGLVSTASDYLRFARMLLGKGQLDGVRIIGPKTLDLMTRNHITGGKTIAAATSAASFQGGAYEGNGFGLGFAVALNTADGQISSSPGEFNWSGAAGTHFWVDPAEDLTVVFMTQYMSLSAQTRYNLAREIRAIVYGALD
jgi:CubicO group peptidase (beta-lactamase class C family)